MCMISHFRTINGYTNLGVCYKIIANIDSAEIMYEKALLIAREHGFDTKQALVIGNLATIKSTQGKLTEALDLLNESLRINEKNEINDAIARDLTNIGTIYSDLDEFEESIGLLCKIS